MIPTTKKKPLIRSNDSVLESLRDLGGNVGKSLSADVVGKVGVDTLTSLFGSLPKQGELKPNEPLKFSPEMSIKSPVKTPEIQPRKTILASDEDRQVKQQLEAVRKELAALAVALKGLHQEVQTAISETPVHPGIYHLNFFERLRSLLKILRQQIEDGRNWLALWTSRKKKMHYWGLYKKHGTKFGLSSERTMATQAG